MQLGNFINKNLVWLSLLIVLILFIWKAYPISNSVGPLDSSDFSAHIFKINYLSEHGVTGWNSYWYGGFPFFKYYPPLSYLIAASMAGIGTYLSYNLLFDIVWLLIPISFLVFLKSFKLTKLQTSIGLLIFSLSPATLVFFRNSNLPFITSFLFSIVFLIYFKKFMDSKTSLHKPILLLIPILLTHVLMALFLYISVAIWFFSMFPTKNQIPNFILVLAIPALITSFWYIPFSTGIYSGREGGVSILSDPLVYTTFTTNQRLTTLGIPRELFMVFAVIMALSILATLRKFREKMFAEFSPWIIISGVLFLFLDYKRIIILMTIPLALMITFNCKKKFLYFLTTPLIITNLMVFSTFALNFEKMPEYPETGDRTIFYDEELTCKGCSFYSVFLQPSKKTEAINGWLPQSQNTNELFEKRSPALQKLLNPLSINQTEFNSLAKAWMINYVAVGKNSNITNYFRENPEFKETGEEKGFIIFEPITPFSYIEINREAIQAEIKKSANRIEVKFNCSPGTITLKETYDKDWEIKLNGENVKAIINQYGFLEIITDKSAGCKIEMEYKRSIF